jgi:hypothetical protein
MELPMSTQRDHHARIRDPEAMSLTLWVGAVSVAMVAFSYWLTMY